MPLINRETIFFFVSSQTDFSCRYYKNFFPHIFLGNISCVYWFFISWNSLHVSNKKTKYYAVSLKGTILVQFSFQLKINKEICSTCTLPGMWCIQSCLCSCNLCLSGYISWRKLDICHSTTSTITWHSSQYLKSLWLFGIWTTVFVTLTYSQDEGILVI